MKLLRTRRSVQTSALRRRRKEVRKQGGEVPRLNVRVRRREAPASLVKNPLLESYLDGMDAEDCQKFLKEAYQQGLKEGGLSEDEVRKAEGSWCEGDDSTSAAV